MSQSSYFVQDDDVLLHGIIDKLEEEYMLLKTELASRNTDLDCLKKQCQDSKNALHQEVVRNEDVASENLILQNREAELRMDLIRCENTIQGQNKENRAVTDILERERNVWQGNKLKYESQILELSLLVQTLARVLRILRNWNKRYTI